MEWNHSTRDFTSEQSKSLMLRKVETFSYDCYICKSTSYYVNIAKTDHCIRVEFLKQNLKEVENSILLKSERKIKKIVMLKSHFVLSRYLNRLPRYRDYEWARDLYFFLEKNACDHTIPGIASVACLELGIGQ